MTRHALDLLVPIAGVLLHAAAALAVGNALLRATAGRAFPGPRPPSLLNAYLLGILLIAAWPWIPEAAASVLGRPWPAWTMAVPLFACAPFAPWRALATALSSCLESARVRSERWWLLPAVSGWLLACGGAAIPPSGMDALAYHLGLPSQYLLRGSLAPLSGGGYAFYFQTFEWAILPLLGIDPTAVAANLLNALLLGAVALAAARIAGALGASFRQASVAAAAVTLSPILVSAVALTKNDVLALAFFLGACLLLLESERGREARPGRPGLAGLCAGAAVAVKPTAAFAVLPLLAVDAVRNRRLLPLLLSAAAPLPWLARNIAYAGTPLPSAFLHGPAFVDFSRESGTGPLGALHHLVLSFFYRYLDGTDGPIGPVLLALGSLALVGALRDRRARSAVLVCGLALATWSLLGHSQARYLLPAILLGAAAGAPVVEWKRAGAAVVLLAALAGSGAYAAWRLEAEHAAWSWHAGRITEERYYERWLYSWPVQDEGRRRLPPGARVLAVGEGELFTLGRVADWDAFWEPSRALAWAHDAGHDSRALHRVLAGHGYTHVLDNPAILEALLRDRRTPPPACPRDRATFDALLRSLPVAVEVPGNSARIYSLEGTGALSGTGAPEGAGD